MRDVGVTKWKLVNYFDVWGDKEGGWQVNNLCIEFDDLNITDDATDKDILDYLKKIGFLTTSDRRRVYLDDMGDMIEIYQRKDNYPLGRLERVW